VLTSVFVAMMLSLSLAVRSVSAIDKGPRNNFLVLRSYANQGDAYGALVVGEIDLDVHELTYAQYLHATTDSELVVCKVEKRDMFQFDINNNRYINTYPNWVSPTSYKQFRQALALLTPKDYIVNVICGGFAERIDQPIPFPLRSWQNWSRSNPYPYEYNRIVAAYRLDQAGFYQGTEENPYYDPDFQGSAQTIRTYPSGHSKAGEKLDPLIMVIRNDDRRMLDTGQLLRDNLRKHGVPIESIERDERYAYGRIFAAQNYHIYTGKWDMGRFPPPQLYALYHSEFSFSGGLNYVTGYETYETLATLLEEAAHSSTYTEGQDAVRVAMGYFTDECITIPLWSTVSYYAWRKDLRGIVNMDAVGLINDWTFMNAYKIDGSPIVIGHAEIPERVNIIRPSSQLDYLYIDRMNLYDGIGVPPYDSTVDQPSFVKTWDVSTYTDPDDEEEKSKISRTYRSDNWFVEPFTGNQLENVNATQVYASMWYFYQDLQSWHSPSVWDIKHINISSDHRTLEIFWDNLSFWNTYLAEIPILSFNLLRSGTISSYYEETIDDCDPWLGLDYSAYWVDEVEYADNGNWVILERGTDWDIFAHEGYSPRADVRILKSAVLDHTVRVKYWAVNDPAGAGVEPGTLPWQEGFEGCGTYYAIDFVYGLSPEVSSLTLKRSSFYYMETPPLGEIDFMRKGNGYFKVDIFDLVIASSAYCS